MFYPKVMSSSIWSRSRLVAQPLCVFECAAIVFDCAAIVFDCTAIVFDCTAIVSSVQPLFRVCSHCF